MVSYVSTLDEKFNQRQKKPSDTYLGYLMAVFYEFEFKMTCRQVCVKYITSAILKKAM